MWTFGLFETRTGEPTGLVLPEPSEGKWDSRISGRGRGIHSFPLYGAGLSKADVREFTTGNKYTLAQMWDDDYVAYAGVITRRRNVKQTHVLTLESAQLRVAYLDDRMLYGVPSYHPTNTVLTVTSRSHAGAARAVTIAGTPGSFALPIDLTSDGSGTFSAAWKHNERLNMEDHLAQIEADGCEIDFRAYLDGSGYLRYEERVGVPTITSGSATELDTDDPAGPVLGLETIDDYAKEMTGVLGFGKNGLTAWQGDDAVDISVRDVWVNFPDIDDQDRLQAAVDAKFDELKEPTSQWPFALYIDPAGDGPEFAEPGRLLTLQIADDEFIPDGPHSKRVVALRGDLGYVVTPEVQDA